MTQAEGTRTARIERRTNETAITVTLDLDRSDGSGSKIATGIGFFDHMLEQLARHSGLDMAVEAQGDRHIDDHHTVEDVGIALGQALASALGDKTGVARYASVALPMDEALVEVALDLSGRPFPVINVHFAADKIGTFDTQLVREFFTAFATNGRLTLHINQRYGLNDHHIAEACFKGVARALGAAVQRTGHALPSTKGAL